MRIMLLGGGGFIGRHIMAGLLAAGHEVVCVVRTSRDVATAFPQASFLQLDLASATDQRDWEARLHGIECIVNTAGILRGAQMDAIHVHMPKALYAAALTVGIRQVVLISAISARADVATDYSQSKLSGEEILRQSGLGWTILRPSLVYAEGSYGGTSLLRGMAALPCWVPLPGNGEFGFTPIHARDLARGVVEICGNADFYGKTLEPVGPQSLSLRELLTRYRAWLGFGRARFMSIPMPLMGIFARMGDVFGDGPVSSNSLAQLVAGNAGDSTAFAKAIGFLPRSLDEAMLARPADVQDRWHARLFFLAPAIKIVLIVLWLASALLGLVRGNEAAQAVTTGLGLQQVWAEPLRLTGSAIDLGVALSILFDRRAYRSMAIQIAVVVCYTAVLSLALPGLWLDPYGPLLKNLPILLLIAAYGVIGNKR